MKNERSANEATTASAKSSWRIIANMRYGVLVARTTLLLFQTELYYVY